MVPFGLRPGHLTLLPGAALGGSRVRNAPGSDPPPLPGRRPVEEPAASRPAPFQLARAARRAVTVLGAAMNDLLVIGMTIVIFALFFLLVRVVEHLER